LRLTKVNLTFRFMTATIFIIVLVMGIKIIYDHKVQQQQALYEMKEKAEVITKQQIATWEFMSINQDNINYDSEGNFEFKHMNCSTVAMGIGVFFAEMTDYKIKPTHLNYRSILNAPDDFETIGLQHFQADSELQEYWSTDTIDGKEVFRYMAPLRIEESCLSCHGEPAGEVDVTGYVKEGYKVGDFGGAISLIMPMDIFIQNSKQNLLGNIFFFLLLIMVCIIAIYYLVRRLVTSPLWELEKAVSEVGKGNLDVNLAGLQAECEIKQLASHFQQMTSQLKDLYNNLESKVEERTTELEKANEILKQHKQELEEANIRLKEVNTYKSEFLAIMSHELRTPLTSVIAFTELLLAEKIDQDNEEKHYLEEIRTNSEILLRMINNILDLAKIEAGKAEITLVTMDMADVIASVESVILPLAKNKGLDVTMEIAPDVPLFKGDPEKIRRIVENLAGNAIKFTEQGGKVEISVKYDSAKEEVLIVVSDTGIGIKKDALKYIFDRFTQADSSTSRKYGGTGLGLALAKELVELHNGWIEVESELNVGSTFTVGIPAKAI
jgi:two-component system sensor histidine kinase BarA